MTVARSLLRRRLLRCITGRRPVLFALALSPFFPLPLQADDFSGPRAYAILETIVRDIGPRPMGSPAEQRALAFAAARFREYGCDTAYVMPMTEAGGVNTTSGIAVGIARGRTGRIIVIGSHMDSSGPDIPGANDDGSGSACVIELARVLAPQDLQSTIVFCCFGGEEEGLRGSTHFVGAFPGIDSVALMVQIDMTDGSSYLEMDPDASFQVSAPRWLPAAAFDIYYNELGFTNLRYVTHSATLNASMARAAGSDHEPFLDRGIPAIDFTSDVSHPIHTPLDNLTTFDSSGLVRSGLLAQRLVERFDGGTPSHATEQYYLLQIGSRLLFVDYWVLWILHGLAFVLAGAAAVRLWRTRGRYQAERPRWSALKILLAAFIIQLFIWIPETVMGALRGYRYPWVNNFGGYVLLGSLTGGIGLWFALNMLRRLRVRTDPFPYFARTMVLLGVVTALLLLNNPEIAFYPGSALLFFSAAVLVRHPIVKGALAVAAFYLPLHLVFMEYLELFQREMSRAILHQWWKVGLVDASYVAMFALLSLPFVFGIAAVVASSHGDLFWLRRFGKRLSLLVLLTAALLVGIVLLNRSVYDDRWPRMVSAEERVQLGTDSSSLLLTSGEPLDGLHVVVAGLDTVIENGGCTFSSRLSHCPGDTLVSILPHDEAVEAGTLADSLRLFVRTLQFHSSHRPLKLEIRYRSDAPFTSKTHWSMRGGGMIPEKSAVLEWYAFPDSTLRVPLEFTVAPGQRIVETIRLVYSELAVPARFERDLTLISTRTVVTRTDTLVVN